MVVGGGDILWSRGGPKAGLAPATLNPTHLVAEALRIPGARLELIPAAGHLVQEDRPEELARLLAAHLSAISD